MNPVTIGIKRSPNRKGISATETEEKISMFEAASDKSFFFIVINLGAETCEFWRAQLGVRATPRSKQYAAAGPDVSPFTKALV